MGTLISGKCRHSSGQYLQGATLWIFRPSCSGSKPDCDVEAALVGALVALLRLERDIGQGHASDSRGWAVHGDQTRRTEADRMWGQGDRGKPGLALYLPLECPQTGWLLLHPAGLPGTNNALRMADFCRFVETSWDVLESVSGAQKRTRTSTPFRAPPPEDGASTNSAIWSRAARAGGR